MKTFATWTCHEDFLWHILKVSDFSFSWKYIDGFYMGFKDKNFEDDSHAQYTVINCNNITAVMT